MESLIEYRKLPNTDLTISRIVFGAEPLGGTDWGTADMSALGAAVQSAVELGINCFDTADVYGLGTSEERLASVLGERRHRTVIVTKGGVRWSVDRSGRAKTWTDCSPEYLQQAIDESLRRLRIDSIPLYLVHRYDPAVSMDRLMELLARNRQAGKIRYFGLSNFPSAAIEQARSIAAVQFCYSLLDCSAKSEILPLARKLGIGTMAYGTLAQGLLTGKYTSESRFEVTDRRHRLEHFQPEGIRARRQLLQRLAAFAAERNVPQAAVAVRWVLDDAAVDSAVIGLKSSEQVRHTADFFGWRLTPSERTALSGTKSTEPT
ncbi:MAG TPA: aldo/keto reductase [Thermoanaerobaculia bacterium]|nr:aldo/keto reductase [Thermoanaerobaculia bacterium]